ncbi:MAG: hypothetical protein AABZ67_09980 [Pseudomonadota bacterium]
MSKHSKGATIAVTVLLAALAGPSGAQQRAAEKSNMELLGYNDLQARSAYHPVLNEQNGRWIAYIGHHGGAALNPLTGNKEPNGTSIVDVTDPKNPKYLHHIPGEAGQGERGGAQMVRTCNGRDLPKGDRSKSYLLRSFGNTAHEIWDVTVPEQPALLTTVVKGLKDTHKNWWECDTGIAYLVSGVQDWRVRRMIQIYDLSDPAKPVFIRNFGLPGQQPGASGPVPNDLHGPISTGPKGNRIYLGYGTNRQGVLQIVDREKLLKGPKEPTVENLQYPEISRINLPKFMGAHTTLPMLGVDVSEFSRDEVGKKRDFVLIVNESLKSECTEEARQLAYVVDITDESNPFPVANYQVAEESGGFCARGGRFGAHASNENQPAVYARRLVFMSWFNAGVRAVDVRDPYRPREAGYYIPAVTDKTTQRCLKTAEGPRCKVAIQTNNVEVDARGYIYIVDRANTGIHILELTGEARKVANFK